MVCSVSKSFGSVNRRRLDSALKKTVVREPHAGYVLLVESILNSEIQGVPARIEKDSDFKRVDFQKRTDPVRRRFQPLSINTMDPNGDRMTSAERNAGYMDDNSNVCKSELDDELIDPDTRCGVVNNSTADQLDDSDDSRDKGQLELAGSSGNSTDKNDITWWSAKDDKNEGNHCNNGISSEGEDSSSLKILDAGSCSDSCEYENADIARDGENSDDVICQDGHEQDSAEGTRQINRDDERAESARSRLASAGNREAIIFEDFDLEDHCQRVTNFSHAADSRVKSDEVERQVVALEPRDGRSIVSDDNNPRTTNSGDGNARDHFDDEISAKADRFESTKRRSDSGTSNWRTCLLCFRERMASLGVTSKSFDSFIVSLAGSSSAALRTTCPGHEDHRLNGRRDEPGVFGTATDTDTTSSGPPQLASGVEKNDDCDNVVAASSTGDEIENDGGPTSKPNIHEKPTAPDPLGSGFAVGDGPMSESCGDVAATASSTEVTDVVLDMLREFGKRLDFERRQRERAEDWAEFLQLELEAQIDARTDAEERRVVLRERIIELVAKYKKLKWEHATLVSQIRDMSRPDTPADRASTAAASSSSSSLLRRKHKPSSANRDSLMAKRNAIIVRHSGRQGSSTDSDNSEGEHFTETNGRRSSGSSLQNLEDVKRKWESKRQKLSCRSNETVSSGQNGELLVNKKYNIADLDDCLSNQNEFIASAMPITSTPVKMDGCVRDERRSLPDGRKTAVVGTSSTATAKDEVESKTGDDNDDKPLVDVKASTNMWEQLLQKKGGVTQTNGVNMEAATDHQEVSAGDGSTSASPKRMQIRDIEEFRRCLEEDTETSSEKVQRGNVRKCSVSLGSEDDEETSDLEYLSANEDLVRSNDILTDSINAKQTRQMWECLSNSTTTNSSPELSKSPKGISSSGVIEQAKAKFETLSECDSHSTHSELALQRSANFSSLKSQWEEKGKCVYDDKS
ncbi:hypothetical protein LSH36_380g04039 [Paralvinella palmiformis]|uniref:Uncharacterized protein n=1 Tax=Paralvinella palmiformis TaxID=53620 RepID=A0AAD9JE60_9ANNE|nr:hypothetical protein LSH36_380g04039 [Paralvinella palmiformis]